MERTPHQVVEELMQVDRPTTARQLASWRSKGLLPPVKRRGRGQSVGAIWIWDQPDIVDRAALVFDLLKLRSRTSFALLGLWRCGFKVDPSDLRPAWTDRLAAGMPAWMREGRGRKTRVKRFDFEFDEMEDHYSAMAYSIARRLEAQRDARATSMVQPVLSILGLLYNVTESEDAEFELGSIMSFFGDSRNSSNMNSEVIPISRIAGPIDAEQRYRHIRDRVSLANVRNQIAKLSDDQISDISCVWRNLVELFSALFGGIVDDNPVLGLTKHRKACCAFGSLGMVALAMVIDLPIWPSLKSSIVLVAGNASLLRALATELQSVDSEPADPVPTDPLSEELRALLDQLTEIWYKPDMTFGQLLGLEK